MAITNPRPDKANMCLAPIETWFWAGDSTSYAPFSLPGIRKASLVLAHDTVEDVDASVLNRAQIPTLREATLTMTVNGITAALLGEFLNMNLSTGGFDLYHGDDIAITTGAGVLTGSPIANKCIYVQDENYRYLDWLGSGAPALGQYTIDGTDLTVNSAVDGVVYTAKYLAFDAAEGNMLQMDFTKFPPRQFSCYIAGRDIDTVKGEPFIDSSNADLKRVTGVYIDKCCLTSEAMIFYSSMDEDHTYDLVFSCRWRVPSDIVPRLVERTSSPTS